jgi:hypothetical protein
VSKETSKARKSPRHRAWALVSHGCHNTDPKVWGPKAEMCLSQVRGLQQSWALRGLQAPLASWASLVHVSPQLCLHLPRVFSSACLLLKHLSLYQGPTRTTQDRRPEICRDPSASKAESRMDASQGVTVHLGSSSVALWGLDPGVCFLCPPHGRRAGA